MHENHNEGSVVISYSHLDQEYVTNLIQCLNQHRLNAWHYLQNRGGVRYIDKIMQQIEEAAAIIVVLSQHSANSDFVEREVNHAIKAEKHIIPLVIEDCRGRVVFLLNNRHEINARDGRDPVSEILEALQDYLPNHSPAQTPIQNQVSRAHVSSTVERTTQPPGPASLTSREPLVPGQVVHERYRIIREIARGGMGRVYEAEHLELEQRVALKEAIADDPKLFAILRGEARLLAKLKHSRHPALPDVTDYFTEANRQYLVMEFIPGDDLSKMLNKGERPFPVQDIADVMEVLDWAEQLLEALEYLHSQEPPIIHRDIKPGNIKLRPGNGKLKAWQQVMLLDFGLAKATNESIHGFTRLYAPPEQIHGSGTDARSDLYSLAATLHHLLSGAEPEFAWERQEQLKARQPDPQRPAHELNPVVPEAVGTWLMGALAFQKEQRPANAIVMLEDLRRIREDLDEPPPPPPPPRWPIKLVLAGVVSMVMLISVVYMVLYKFDLQVASAYWDSFVNAISPADTPLYQDELTYATDAGEIHASATADVLNATEALPNQVISTGYRAAAPDISADGQCLAFHAEQDGNKDIFIQCGRDTEPRPLTNHPANDENPTWSTDSTWLAFVSARDGVSEIYKINKNDPNNLVKLTDYAAAGENALIGTLDWSEAGILFDREGDIWRMDADGENLANLTNSPKVKDVAPAWSHDATKIAFASEQDGGALDIFVMYADGSNPVNLTQNPQWVDTSPTWSPDGQFIVFRSARDKSNAELYRMDTDGANPINLTNTSDIQETDPVWSPARAEP